MKIVIVGAGISGLTTDLFLRKLSSHLHIPLDLIIYEKHRAAPNVGNGVGAPTVGGALGLAPNGLHVLRDLDEELFLQVVALGYSISHFSMRTSPGRTLASFPAADSGKPPLHTLLISRQLFWETLRSKVPDDVVVHANIAEVQCHGSQRPRVVFADGAPDVEADLVIGADGVRSIVQRAVTGDGKEDQQPAIFEGLVGVGGFMPASRLSPNHPPGQKTLTFGAHGFFGYGPCALSTPVNQADELPEKETLDFVDIKRQLQQRRGDWADPVIRDLVANAEIDSIYPTWTTPELPTWENSGIVLVGDAAHALQTSSGQGASQALEDAQTLSMLLMHHLGKTDVENAVRLASKEYVEIRKPRIKRIVDRAK